MSNKQINQEIFIKELEGLARKHGENVSDHEAWLENFESGDSAEAHFYEEYPEHMSDVKLKRGKR